MSQEFLHQDLALFIAEHVRSVEQLEVLLLLHPAGGQEWTADAIYARVKTNRDSISQRLKELVESGVLVEIAEEPPRYRFQPRKEQFVQLVSDLAVAYKGAPVRVIEAIYSPTTASLREFARAFRLKGEQ